MQPLKAQVKDGYLVLKAPTDLPEGEVVELKLAEEVFDRDDGISDQDREHIHEQIIASIRQRRAGGRTYDADEAMAKLASEL